MKPSKLVVMALFGTFFSLFLGCATSSSGSLQSENADLRRQVAELRAELEATRQPAATATATEVSSPPPSENGREQLEVRIAEAEREIEDLKAEREQLELLAGVTSKGDAVESAVARIEERYDASTDRTRVVAKPRLTRPEGLISPAAHFLGASFDYAGSPTPNPSNPSELQLNLFTVANPTQQYEGFRRVTLEIDGEKVELPVDRYRLISEKRLPQRTGRQTNNALRNVERDELLDIGVDDEIIRRAARAGRLRLLLPNGLKFDLGREGVALFAAMQARRGGTP